MALGVLGSVMIMGAMGPRVGETSSDMGSPAAGGVGGVSGQASSLRSSAMGLDTRTARDPHPTALSQQSLHCGLAAGWVARGGGDGGGERIGTDVKGSLRAFRVEVLAETGKPACQRTHAYR